MKIAIMQPYVFPYIGYFQLINAVDVFVFYDDVNFIKKGFINRNTLLFHHKAHRFTIPCKAVSQNKNINEIAVDASSNTLIKLQASIALHYKSAPYYNEVMPLLTDFFMAKPFYGSIASMAMHSVQMVAKYLEMSTKFEVSSETYKDTQHLTKADRLVAIAKKAHADTYINAIGGQALYTKQQFANQNLELYFLQSNAINYLQFNTKFVPWLSIIDVMMFNDKETIHKFLNSYTLL
jgi:hypothetical protein